MPRPKGLPKTGGRKKGTPNKKRNPFYVKQRAEAEAKEAEKEAQLNKIDPYFLQKKKKMAARDRHYRNKYEVSLAQMQIVAENQNHACAICGSPGSFEGSRNETFHLDHDHVTGKIRGLLCRSCNLGLGFFKDSAINLSRAIEYLICE